MSKVKYHLGQRINPYHIACIERSLLMRNYDHLRDYRIVRDCLRFNGSFRPTSQSVDYDYSVSYMAGERPKVSITNPIIPYQDEIHMYKDGSLCLYYPEEFIFRATDRLWDTIIPWTHGWIVFYELFKLFGVWMHPEQKHISK